MAEKLITPVFRGSFVHLLKPHLMRGETDEDKARYQITIVLPSKDAFWKKVQAEIQAAGKEKFGKIPKKFKKPVKKGDESEYEEFAGCYTLQASTKRKPDLCDAGLQPIMDPDEIYSGAYFRASIRAYAWDHPTGGKGVSFALDNVMKIKDGDPLSGAGTAAGDFADFAEESDGDGDDLLD
jgi:hypothetical protein